MPLAVTRAQRRQIEESQVAAAFVPVDQSGTAIRASDQISRVQIAVDDGMGPP